jgi:deferrochelatase/peroxidase EfeB
MNRSSPHVHLANSEPNLPVENPDSRRIFRQGYQYFEPHPQDGFRVGLNFVSFQNTPTRLIGALTDPKWLGRTNFGGTNAVERNTVDPPVTLLTVYAAGMFIVPPWAARERFPGAGVLNDPPV